LDIDEGICEGDKGGLRKNRKGSFASAVNNVSIRALHKLRQPETPSAKYGITIISTISSPQATGNNAL
jgi:hypothetical protein